MKGGKDNMGLFGAARMGNRMGARQQYRTMARMQRRRSYMQNAMGMHQDFSQREDEPVNEGSSGGEVEMDYTAELQQLSKLKSQGLITEEEYNAKKKQILGI